MTIAYYSCLHPVCSFRLNTTAWGQTSVRCAGHIFTDFGGSRHLRLGILLPLYVLLGWRWRMPMAQDVLYEQSMVTVTVVTVQGD